MLDTRDFCRYLRSVRDGEMDVPTSWANRFGFGDEPLANRILYRLTHAFEKVTLDDVVLALAHGAMNASATHVTMLGTIKHKTDTNDIDTRVIEFLMELSFEPFELWYGVSSYRTRKENKLMYAVGLALFSTEEEKIQSEYCEGEIMVSG